MIPLLVGTALALGMLSFVLYPLFVESAAPLARSTAVGANEETNRNQAIDALREIEFDRETGKLSDLDYTSLRNEYTQRAVAVMRAGDRRVCPTCGPRPETDAVFCSNCGIRLDA